MRTTDYNGYTNHATWYTASHIVLDEGTGWVASLIEDMYFNGLAFDIVKRALDMREERGIRSWTVEDEAVATCAKYFSHWFEGVCLSQGDSITAQFARFYAEDIDWHQIAAHVLDYDDCTTALTFAAEAHAVSRVDGIQDKIKASDFHFRSWSDQDISSAVNQLKALGYKDATEDMETFEYHDIKFIKA